MKALSMQEARDARKAAQVDEHIKTLRRRAVCATIDHSFLAAALHMLEPNVVMIVAKHARSERGFRQRITDLVKLKTLAANAH